LYPGGLESPSQNDVGDGSLQIASSGLETVESSNNAGTLHGVSQCMETTFAISNEESTFQVVLHMLRTFLAIDFQLSLILAIHRTIKTAIITPPHQQRRGAAVSSRLRLLDDK
jgi:hypothetical protein